MRKYAQSLKRSLQSLVQIYLRYDFFIFHWEYLKCHKDVKKPTQSWCLHFCLCHVTAPNLCWLISALCSLCVFVHCLFCPRIMGFAHFSVDLMLHNSVRSFKFAPYAEMHRRTRTSLSCSFRDQHFCFHVMYERESCLLLEILFFFFSPGDVTESILMVPFFFVLHERQKSLCFPIGMQLFTSGYHRGGQFRGMFSCVL